MKSTIQKHSRCASSPGGTASQARTQASSEAREGEAPRLAHREGARGQRPLRLVHAVDLEVVDLVDGVARGVQDRRHERAPEDGQEGRSVTALARAVGAPGGHGAAHDAEGGRQEREGPREVDVGLRGSFVHSSQTSRAGRRRGRRSRCWPRSAGCCPSSRAARPPCRGRSRPGCRGGPRPPRGGRPARRRGRRGRRSRPPRARPGAAERALEAHRPLGARRHGPQRRDQEGAAAVGLAHLGRAGVGGGGRHRGRVGEGQQVAQARRAPSPRARPGRPGRRRWPRRSASRGPRPSPARSRARPSCGSRASWPRCRGRRTRSSARGRAGRGRR